MPAVQRRWRNKFDPADNHGRPEKVARVTLDAIGVDPYDVDLAILRAHCKAREAVTPVTRFPGPGSLCFNFRAVDFVVHRWLPATLVERYPKVAASLIATSPRWGEGHECGIVPLPVPNFNNPTRMERV